MSESFWDNKRVTIAGGSGFRASTPFEEGLRRAVEWYKRNRRVPQPL